MSYNTYTMPDGLRVVHLHSSSHVVYCGYAVNAGTRDETPQEEGLAHLCEHMTFKGTERRRAWHILRRLESVGGDLNAFTSKEDTVYHAAVLREHVPRAVDLLDDIVFHSIYPPTELTKEIEVVCDEIESYNDSPVELVADEFDHSVFSGHPLGHNILGNAERLRRYATSDVQEFTRRLYVPSNAVFFVYGDVDFHLIVRLLEKAGHGTPAPQVVIPNRQGNVRTVPMPVYEPRHTVKEMGTHLAHVTIGNRAFARSDSRYEALRLLTNILGGPGMSARLSLTLRERNALVYSVESYLSAYSDTGLWAVYFGCEHRNVERCMQLVRRELDRMADIELTPAQLTAAKKQIKGQIGVACDNREGFAIDFARCYLHFGRTISETETYAAIDAVTAPQIRQVAQTLFTDADLTSFIIR